MPTVTVDADDLEALLFASGGIKELETGINLLNSTLRGRKGNPMVSKGEAKLAEAHDRLSTAWRRAKREADWPKRLVTETDIAELKALFLRVDGTYRDFALLNYYPMHLAQDLLLVEAGPRWEGYQIEWPAPAEPQFVKAGNMRYAAKLSFYGLQVLGITEADIKKTDSVAYIGGPMANVPMLGRAKE
jgi:hypothetical protein